MPSHGAAGSRLLRPFIAMIGSEGLENHIAKKASMSVYRAASLLTLTWYLALAREAVHRNRTSIAIPVLYLLQTRTSAQPRCINVSTQSGPLDPLVRAVPLLRWPKGLVQFFHPLIILDILKPTLSKSLFHRILHIHDASLLEPVQ